MPFRNLPLPKGIKGNLYLHSMLGYKTPYADDVTELKAKSISTVIRLTSDEETKEKSTEYWNSIRKKAIRWEELHFPIRDYGIPDNLVAFGTLIETIAKRLSEGQGMLLHCAAGIGRTGTVACAILIQLGVKIEDAVRMVGEAGSYAEERIQVEFLKTFSKGH
jgi:protein-tyrosine phosphatase